jgi:hypothetical protein
MSKHLESALAKIQHATKKRFTRDYREAVLTEDECRAIQSALDLARLNSSSEPLNAGAITTVIVDAVETYEYRGDDGDYTPNERERALLLDFAHGVAEEVERLLAAGPSARMAVCDFCGRNYTPQSACCDRRRAYLAEFASPAATQAASRTSDSIPPGWTIKQTTEGLLVSAPDCDPGGATMPGPGVSLVNRLLYRLASDLISHSRSTAAMLRQGFSGAGGGAEAPPP